MTAAENREEIIDRLKKIRISPVAVHEAGHAVAACARRIVFARVVLHPEPRQEGEDLVPGELQGIVHPLLGRTQIKRRLFYFRLNDLIVVQLAGREAMELLFNGSAGYDKDYEQAHAVLAMRSPESSPEDRQFDIQLLRQQAAALMRKHLVGLIVVAARLEQRRHLTAREVRQAVYRKQMYPLLPGVGYRHLPAPPSPTITNGAQ